MMEDLQQAYHAYQQALYHLRDPKVSIPLPHRSTSLTCITGAEALVRYRHTLRSLRIARARRRSILASHADAARFRES